MTIISIEENACVLRYGRVGMKHCDTEERWEDK